MKLPVYLDYSATTPVDPRVAQKMIPYLSEHFGNPASRSHAYGRHAEQAVEEARAAVALLLGADPREIVWTSGATEGNNLAIKGTAQFHRAKGRHLVTQRTEHKAVLDSMHELERHGFTVTYLDVPRSGIVDPQVVRAAIRADTILVSIMMVNNEIGVIQPIAQIGEVCRSAGVVFHVDAVQAAGKVGIDLSSLKVDLMTVSAHKMYGPKGIGALYVRRKPRVRLEAQIHGGGQERGFRSGTLATHQIVGMGEAARIARIEMAADNERIRGLRDRLWEGVSRGGEVTLNGDRERRISGNLNVSFKGIDGEALMAALPEIAVSSGSACTSASVEPSYVLRALGLTDELAHGAIRFTVGKYTSIEEIDFAIARVCDTVARLRLDARPSAASLGEHEVGRRDQLSPVSH